MLRRSYAFEAEGVAEEVIDSLETVEDVVDQNCATPADCDAMLEKVEQQEEKFDGALQTMADAAKDAQATGDSGALAESIEPAMNELREVAEDTGIAIGTAAESAGITQSDLLRIRSYLVGTREIIEAKKAELMGATEGYGYAMESDSEDDDDEDEDGDDADSKSDDDDEDEDEDDEDEDDDDSKSKKDDEDEKAEEAFIDYCLEAYMDTLMEEMDDSITMYAMEGVTTDAVGAFASAISATRGLKKEMKAAAAEGDYRTAAAKAKECAAKFDEVAAKVSALPQSVASTVLVNGALALITLGAVTLGGKGIKAAKNKITGRFGLEGRQKAIGKKLSEAGGIGTDQYKQLAAKRDKIGNAIIERNAKQAKRAERIAGIKNATVGKVTNSKVGQGIAGAHASAQAAAKQGKMTVMAGLKGTKAGQFAAKHPKATGAVKGVGTAIGVAGKGVGVGAAASGLMAFLKKKQVVDEEGNTHSSHLEANDVNAVIAMIRKLCAENKKKYLGYAAEYEQMAQGAATNAAAESFIDMMQGMQINSAPAMEGAFDLDAFYAGFFGAAQESAAMESVDPNAFLDAFVNG